MKSIAIVVLLIFGLISLIEAFSKPIDSADPLNFKKVVPTWNVSTASLIDLTPEHVLELGCVSGGTSCSLTKCCPSTTPVCCGTQYCCNPGNICCAGVCSIQQCAVGCCQPPYICCPGNLCCL